MKSCSGDSIAYTTALKGLQDLCSSSGELPSSFTLKNVTFDRMNVVGKGGEVSVYSGDLKGQKVVVREVVMSPSYRSSPEGKKIIKVITNTEFRLSAATYTISFSCLSARRSLIHYWITQTSSLFLEYALTALIHPQ